MSYRPCQRRFDVRTKGGPRKSVRHRWVWKWPHRLYYHWLYFGCCHGPSMQKQGHKEEGMDIYAKDRKRLVDFVCCVYQWTHTHKNSVSLLLSLSLSLSLRLSVSLSLTHSLPPCLSLTLSLSMALSLSPLCLTVSVKIEWNLMIGNPVPVGSGLLSLTTLQVAKLQVCRLQLYA